MAVSAPGLVPSPGTGPGAGRGRAGAAGVSGAAGALPFVSAAAACPSRAATASAALGAAAAAAGAAGADAGAPGAAAAGCPARVSPRAPARACLGCWVANASLSLRTTGASIVEDADRTNSPISWSLAITALLSTPNSFASSYTRTFATALPLLGPARPDHSAGRGSACSVRRQPLLFIAACSSVAHRNLSLLSPGRVAPALLCDLPALVLPRSGSALPCSALPCHDWPRYSASLPVPTGPGSRSARANARRRCASSKHPWLGCRYAPRPGPRAGGSGTISFPAATRRSKSDLAARAPHPTQVRIARARRAGCGYRMTIFAKLTVRNLGGTTRSKLRRNYLRI